MVSFKRIWAGRQSRGNLDSPKMALKAECVLVCYELNCKLILTVWTDCNQPTSMRDSAFSAFSYPARFPRWPLVGLDLPKISALKPLWLLKQSVLQAGALPYSRPAVSQQSRCKWLMLDILCQITPAQTLSCTSHSSRVVPLRPMPFTTQSSAFKFTCRAVITTMYCMSRHVNCGLQTHTHIHPLITALQSTVNIMQSTWETRDSIPTTAVWETAGIKTGMQQNLHQFSKKHLTEPSNEGV